ncbi:MAG: helix-turn-helix domain-containing protein [Chitinophagaceae bacterium]|nr:helix-turn-helix domain-containing protein [Chitinophagaceae bacterium]
MSYTVNLTSAEELELKRLRRVEKNGKLLRRYQCLWMAHENFPKKEIATTLGINIDTITDWIKLFNKSRLGGLGKLHYEGRRLSSLDSVKDVLIKYIKDKSVSKLSELQDFLKTKHCLVVEHSWLSRYCKKTPLHL